MAVGWFYLFAGIRVYTSPYRYAYYPVWWEPWPVVVYDVYYPAVSVYHTHYAISDGYRFVNIHENYHKNYRVTSHFNYHEKTYGSGKDVTARQDGDNGKPGNKPGKDHSNKSVQPVKNVKPDKSVNPKSGGNDNDVFKNTSGKKKENVKPKSPGKSQPSSPEHQKPGYKSGRGGKGHK